MPANVLTIDSPKKVRLRGIILPNEHGSWGFLFEPLLAAVVVAPTLSAFWISVFVTGAFLARQPLKVFASNWKTRRNPDETAVAFRYTLYYGTVFLIGLLGSIYLLPLLAFVPFVLVVPLAIYQLYCDVSRKSRQLIPELTGAVAISSSAAVIALAGGWSVAAAVSLWGIFIARMIPSIGYVRNRLKLEKGKEYSGISVAIVHFLALGFIGVLSGFGLASELTLAIFVILLGRAVLGLSAYRRKMKAMKIGIWEVIYGVLVVLSVIVGHYLNI
ncbi:MAG: YwiC-like family protein [Pyrinomonadaceae bacterium]